MMVSDANINWGNVLFIKTLSFWSSGDSFNLKYFDFSFKKMYNLLTLFYDFDILTVD